MSSTGRGVPVVPEVCTTSAGAERSSGAAARGEPGASGGVDHDRRVGETRDRFAQVDRDGGRAREQARVQGDGEVEAPGSAIATRSAPRNPTAVARARTSNSAYVSAPSSESTAIVSGRIPAAR